MKIAIEPSGPIDWDVGVPGSKSLTNRALVAAAQAPGRTRLLNASFSDDSRFLARALGQVGLEVEAREEDHLLVVQGGAIGPTDRPVFLGNAGTALRFFTSLSCLGQGTYSIDGDERMRERPIGGLVEALRGLGASIEYARQPGYPPLVVQARGLSGGRTVVQGDTSSQFVSSVLLAAPGASGPVELEVAGEIASKPYIDLTIDVMHGLGVPVEREGHRRFRIPAGARYGARDFAIEADGASAGYFLAMAATTRGRTKVRGIGSRSHQGEIRFAKILGEMGCSVTWEPDSVELRGGPLRGVEVDMNDCPDSVQTLACVALFASGPTRVHNVRNLRVKETDRISAIAEECSKVGAKVLEHEDGFTLEPPAAVAPAEVETYQDHRMAMSFAVAAVAAPGITIRDPACVSKSYPGFFEQLSGLGVRLRRI